jgi:sporulation protein YlmC with PRC-barrel domain
MAAMATEFTIGARASCSDGLAGEVSGIITDPSTLTVTHLVIEPKHNKQDSRLVPLELVDAASGAIRLRCTLAEFDGLERAEEVDLVAGENYGGGYGSPESVQGLGNVGGMGVGGSVSGVSIGGSLGHRVPTTLNDVVPVGEAQVRHGDPVYARDGGIGQVQGFVVDPDHHQVTHVLLREGHLWGHKEVAIPVSAVVNMDDGIKLNLTKKQIEDLPPVS